MLTTTDYKSIYFLHIPKTAGTSLVAALNDNLSSEVVYKAKRFYKIFAASPFIDHAVIENTPLIYGHIPSNISYLQMEPVFRFTFLRNPVQLTISYFYYAKRLGLIDNKFSLKEFIHSDFKWSLANQQVRWLANSKMIAPNSNATDVSLIDSDDLNLAKFAVESFDFIGFVERYAESVDCLRSMLGFDKFDINQLNTGNYHSDLSSTDVRLIEDMNEADFCLYDYAVKRFGNKSKKVILGPRLLGDRYYASPYRFFLNISDSRSCNGLYSKEIHPDLGDFRWTAEKCHIPIAVSLRKNTQYTLKICLVNCINYSYLSQIEIYLNCIKINFSLSLDNSVAYLQALVTCDVDVFSPTLSIVVPFANKPSIDNPDQIDDRVLGVALSWIYLGVADEIIEVESQGNHLD